MNDYWWVDCLFMLGLLGIGAALVLGVAMRLTAASGTLLLALMWLAEWHPARTDRLDQPVGRLPRHLRGGADRPGGRRGRRPVQFWQGVEAAALRPPPHRRPVVADAGHSPRQAPPAGARRVPACGDRYGGAVEASQR